MTGTLQPEGGHTRISHSRGFCQWLQQNKCSLVFSTYGTGQVCCVGTQKNGDLSFQQTGYGRVLGLWASPQTLWLAVRSVVWRLENALAEGERAGVFDRVFEPRLTYITGDLDIHELGVAGEQLIFVNTKYSCLGAPSTTHNFKPAWKPDFISQLAPDDRCHLNGLAIAVGEPRYVTALSATDTAEGWRNNPNAGVLIDVATNRVVADGLCQPNSPRLHDGKIWLLESGRGQIVTIDPQTGTKEDVAFCPGFPRGLAFHRHFAVITVSKPREQPATAGVPLGALLKERGAQPRCAVFIVDTRNGALIEWLGVEGLITELFDVAVLPGVAAPMADGPTTPGLGSRQIIEPS